MESLWCNGLEGTHTLNKKEEAAGFLMRDVADCGGVAWYLIRGLTITISYE